MRWERSASKVFLAVFWDNKGILSEEYAPKGVAMTKETYFNTLLHLREAIKKKHPGKLSQGVILLHDNGRPHKTRLIIFLLIMIFSGMCSGTLCICSISHTPIIICLHTFIIGWEGNNFHRMQKWKWQSITISKNWTKVLCSRHFSYLTAGKIVLLALVTICRSACQYRNSIKVNFTLVTCQIIFWFLGFFWVLLLTNLGIL